MADDYADEWGMRAFSLAGMVPELAPPFARTAPVRVPELRNVALTRRVLRVLDHPDVQRLRRVRQLGPTHLVYPGATHTRFEHSIGVYENVRHYLTSLLQDRSFVRSVCEEDLLTGLAAGLLHDLGHYPFAHSLEALHHKGLAGPRHEDLASSLMTGLLSPRPLAGLLEKEWRVDPGRVSRLIAGSAREQATAVDRVLWSILHAPIDADKMDYLERDSIHMGVPYGRNYDRDRLLSTLRVDPDTGLLAVSDKGRISAEIFIFCRYTMFSEAYWHHTVRSASAMVERALEDFRLRSDLEGDGLARFLLGHGDEGLLRALHGLAPEASAARNLLEGLAGGTRLLFKRVLTLSRVHRDAGVRRVYEAVFRLDRAGVHACEEAVRRSLSRRAGRELLAWEVIVDTPPPGKDRIEDVAVLFGDRTSAPLSSLSKIVEGISTDFVKVVKKIRVFVSPRAAGEALRSAGSRRALADDLLEALEAAAGGSGTRES